MKEYFKKVPYYLWCLIILFAVVSVMEIRHLPPQIEKYIYIENLRKAEEKPYKTEDYILEYYSTKERFVAAMKADGDVKESYYTYMMEKIDDPAENRRYAKLTLYYDVSTSYTIRHNIWFTIRTKNDKPFSVFEVILSRMDLNDLFVSRSVDGRTYILNHRNNHITVFGGFSVYPDAIQKISGAHDVYYESLLSDKRKSMYPFCYRDEMELHRYYRQFHEIYFMEME